MAQRVRRARDEIIAKYPGQTVVVVSHVTPIKVLLMLALDAPLMSMLRLHLDTASISELGYERETRVLWLWNNTPHAS